MSDRLDLALIEHTAALKAYRLAYPGQRTKTAKRLHDAATELLAAEAEAKRIERVEAA